MTNRLRNMASIYLFYQNQVLMLYRIGSRVVAPSWCGIGGHFEHEELNDPAACVLRELYEETGIEPAELYDLRLRYITLRMKNNEIRQNYYFFAQLKDSSRVLPECNEGLLEWIDVKAVMQKEMPCTAFHCLKHYFQVGKETSIQYAGIATETGIDFVALTEF